MRWHQYDSSEVMVVDRALREEMVKNVKLFLEHNPDEPYCVRATGDTLVVGTSNLDGDVSVYDTRIRGEWWAERTAAPPREVVMTLTDYQRQAARTLEPSDGGSTSLAVAGLGLTGEAGEVADIIKKVIAQGHPLDRDKLVEEVGDVLWYAAMLCTILGVDLGAAAKANINKIMRRYPNGFESSRSRNR